MGIGSSKEILVTKTLACLIKSSRKGYEPINHMNKVARASPQLALPIIKYPASLTKAPMSSQMTTWSLVGIKNRPCIKIYPVRNPNDFTYINSKPLKSDANGKSAMILLADTDIPQNTQNDCNKALVFDQTKVNKRLGKGPQIQRNFETSC